MNIQSEIDFLFLGLRGQSKEAIDDILSKERLEVASFLMSFLIEANERKLPWWFTPIQK